MKRFVLCVLTLILMSLAVCAASAETLGWGFVNNTDVALRREKCLPALSMTIIPLV